jgi:hypothetical protein
MLEELEASAKELKISRQALDQRQSARSGRRH